VDTQTLPSPPAAAADTVSGGVDPKTGMVESKFIATLRTTLMENPAGRPWPSKDLIKDPEKALAQMSAMFRALFKRLELKDDLAAGPANSATRVVSDMLGKSKWPQANARFPVPAEYNDKKFIRAFRRYEVACAMSIFYQAFHGAGGGGVPTDWPPKNP
jgi:hypothetical protein